MYRLAEDGDNLKDAINNIIKRDAGTDGYGTRIRWVDFDGNVLDRQTGQVIGTSEPTLSIKNGAGEHMLITHSSGSPTLFEVQDAGVTLLLATLTINDWNLTGTGDDLKWSDDGAVERVRFGDSGSTFALKASGPLWTTDTLTINDWVAAVTGDDLKWSDDGGVERVRFGDNASTFALTVTGDMKTTTAITINDWKASVSGDDLVWVDDAGAEIVRFGDTSSTWHFKVTGPAQVTGDLETGGNLIMNSSGYLQLGSSTVANSGTVRGPATMTVKSRNAANSANITLIEIDGSDNVFVGNGCTVGILYTGSSQRVRWDSTGVGFNGSGTVAKPTLGAAAGAAYGAGEQSLLNNIRSCLQNVGLAN